MADLNKKDGEIIDKVKEMNEMTKLYTKQISLDLSVNDTAINYLVGKVQARQQLVRRSEAMADDAVLDCLSLMVNSVSF